MTLREALRDQWPAGLMLVVGLIGLAVLGIMAP